MRRCNKTGKGTRKLRPLVASRFRKLLRGQDLNLRPLGYEFEDVDACALLSILYVPSLSLFSRFLKPLASQLRPEKHPRTSNDEGERHSSVLILIG